MLPPPPPPPCEPIGECVLPALPAGELICIACICAAAIAAAAAICCCAANAAAPIGSIAPYPAWKPGVIVGGYAG
jgi:hypothetical protein